MIFSEADFPFLKRSLLIFLSVLCAGGAAIVVSKTLIANAQREQQAAQRQMNTARGQLANAAEDRENMKAYAFEYGELLKRNIIGDDQRLDWIEGLEKLRKQRIVLDFKYTIVPQHSYTPPAPLNKGNFDLNMSDMTLQFDLLHEEQLMAFFDALRTDISGWFILAHCAVERSTDAEATDHLKATCTGGWLTLKSKNAK